MYVYAQINEDNVCIAVSQLSGLVDLPNMIKLDSYDLSVLGKKYNNGIWEEVPKSEVEEPVYVTNEQLSETQLTIMEAMAEQYEQNLDNRLNDMEVQATIYEAVLSLSESSIDSTGNSKNTADTITGGEK